MSRRVIAATAASVVLLLGATGCGSGVQERSAPPTTSASDVPTTTTEAVAPATTGTIAPDSAGICDSLARIAAADRASSQQSQDVTDWEELQPLIVENAEAAVDLYDEALAVAPSELVESLTLIRDVTAAAGEAARESATQEEFSAAGQDLPGFAEAQGAVTELNRFSQRTCGFTLADN